MKCMFNILSNILIDHICDLNQYWYCTIVSTSIHSSSIFLDIVFIQGWQTYLVFYSIQSHYIDFKIPQMCFIISSCEIHSQMNPCSTNCIVQRREIFYSLFVCKSCFDYSIFITFWDFIKNLGDPQEEKRSWRWMTVISRGESYFARCTKKKAYTAHGLMEWLPSRALKIWRSWAFKPRMREKCGCTSLQMKLNFQNLMFISVYLIHLGNISKSSF